MKRKLMLLLACLFVGIGLVTAQTQKVTGVVISEEDGQPVIGASVLVKGTQIGAITGVDGDFTLPNVPSSAKTLVISYIGMQTQEVTIKPHVRVVMQSDTELLDEVVVVAYGTATKRSFTGSATEIKGDRIANKNPSELGTYRYLTESTTEKLSSLYSSRPALLTVSVIFSPFTHRYSFSLND